MTEGPRSNDDGLLLRLRSARDRLAASRFWVPLQVVLIAGLFLLQQKQMLGVLKNQGPKVYESWSIVVAALARPGVAVAVVLGILIAALGFRRLRWSSINVEGVVRVPLCAAVLVLATYYSTYDINLFFAQTHTLDRLLVLGLGVGVVFYAGLTPLFLVVVVLVMGQFSLPIGYSWADVGLLVYFVMIANAWLALRLLLPVDGRGLLYLWLCAIGAAYFDAAWKKWALSPNGTEWALHDDIGNLFVSSHLNGWLPDLSNETVLAWGRRISAVAVPMQVFTHLLEAAPVLLFFSRRFAALLLLAMVGMHVGIMASSGILFWKWSVVDVALAFVIWRRGEIVWPSYRWALAVIAIPIVIFGGRIGGVGSSLGWFDTRLSQFHTFMAVSDDGARYRLDELDFGPYDKTIAQDRFFALHDAKQTTVTLGATYNFKRMEQLQAATTPAKVKKIMAAGKSLRNEAKAARFDRFVRRTMRARNDGVGQGYLLSWFSGPMHIHHHAPTAQRIPAGVPIRTVEVHFHEVLYTGDDLIELSTRKVRDIHIPR